MRPPRLPNAPWYEYMWRFFRPSLYSRRVCVPTRPRFSLRRSFLVAHTLFCFTGGSSRLILFCFPWAPLPKEIINLSPVPKRAGCQHFEWFREPLVFTERMDALFAYAQHICNFAGAHNVFRSKCVCHVYKLHPCSTLVNR